MAIRFTQGDNVVLTLTAKDGAGNPISLSGATFSTQILGNNSTGPVVFPNGQHTIVDSPNGVFTLTLSSTDTQSCGLGPNKEIITSIIKSGVVLQAHGAGILTVLSATPAQ